MLVAIIGDVVGSGFEFNPINSKKLGYLKQMSILGKTEN